MSPPGPRASTLLKLGLLALFLVVTNHGFADRAAELVQRGHWLAICAFGGIWAASVAALAIAAFLPAWWMRLLWCVPVALSTFFGNLAYAIAKSHLTLYEVVLYWSERSLFGDAASAYSSWALLPLGGSLLGVAALLLPPAQPLVARRGRLAAPAVPLVLIAVLLLLEGGKGTRALPEQFNALAMLGVTLLRDPLGELAAERRAVSLTRSGAPPVRHVFLVVDESVRADFIDLNQPRGVTPGLSSHADRIANFGYAVSGNNCSLFSNLILRLGGVPQRLPESLATGPSIWSYARASGYRSVYIDGQKSGGRLQNGMTLVERREIDAFEQPSGVPDLKRDFHIARRLEEIARSDRPQFVYVNKKGSHFPYNRTYPRDAAAFVPDMRDGESIGDSRERLVNSYKNSIRWHVDGFFAHLLEADLSSTVLIYTSDHGQNLMDRGVMTQCNSSDPHVFEGLVPLLVVTAIPELQERFREAAVRNRDRAGHFQIFPTLLELFGFEPGQIQAEYGPGLLQELHAESLQFTYGPILLPGRVPRWKSMPTDLREMVAARAG